jgi:hypothetical protein
MTEIAINAIQDDDVLLGRGPFCYRNPGNIKFRSMIRSCVDKYVIDAPRSYKSNIVQALIKTANDKGIRFIVRSKQDGNWYEAHPYVVQLKVSHALRDARNSITTSVKNKKTTSSSDPKQSWKQSTRKDAISSFLDLVILRKYSALQAQESQLGPQNINPIMGAHIHKHLDKVKSYESIEHGSEIFQSSTQ